MIPVSKPSVGFEELELVKKVFDSNWLGSGAQVVEFEKKLSDFLGSKYVIAVNSGTSALHLALEAAGVMPGHEVIVPAITFCASVQAIIMCGARPVFCEVSPATLCADPQDMGKLITKNTKAILPVHYAGICAQMDQILELGRVLSIKVVEDAAHAFGSSFNGAKIGSFGDLTCFSFDPIKNITCGEGGAIATSDERLSNLIMKKRVLGIAREGGAHSIQKPYEVVTSGYRYHMSNINAAIGLVQLTKFNVFRDSKIRIVNLYNEAFSGIGEVSLLDWNLSETFPFIYVMRVPWKKRDALMRFLEVKGICTSINYIPNHLQPFFRNGQELPVTEKLFDELITLPLFVDMTEDQIQLVIDSVIEFFKK